MNLLKLHYSEALRAVDDLKAWMSSVTPTRALAFEIPRVPSDDEHAPITHVDTAELHGDTAVAHLKSGMRDFWMVRSEEDDLSSKCVARYPGLLQYPAEHLKTAEPLIAALNETKRAFHAHLLERFKTRSERFEAVHEAAPGLITLQFIRAVPLHTDPLRSVGWSWARKFSLVNFTRDELFAKLLHISESDAVDTANTGWSRSACEYALSELQHRPPHQQYQWRRSIKVHPVCNLRRASDEHGPKSLQKKASLPLFLFQDSPLTKISPLANFADANQAASRPGVTHRTPFIPELNLYIRN